jgi:hypothetical protein
LACDRGGFALGPTDQVVPFHRTAKVLAVELTTDRPTAKHVVGAGQSTPSRSLLVPPGAIGRAEMDQLAPFQRSMRALRLEPLK